MTATDQTVNNIDESSWLQSVVTCSDGYEVKAVEQFTDRLIRLARTRLPDRLKRRVDPEDIVQSAFQSFFKRNGQGRFELKNSSDIWRLLAAITYHKVLATIEHHSRQKRDFGRDLEKTKEDSHPWTPSDDAASVSAIAMMTELLEQILNQLPLEHQTILQLRLENFSVDEIAQRTHKSSRTVDRALQRARKIAEKLLNENKH